MNIILTLFLCLIALLYILDAVTAIVPGSIPVFPSSGGAQIAVTEARHTRKVFYVGGEYNKTATGTILKNQIYVEQLTPAGGVTQPRPLILIHGGVLSGDLWLNKPDGGRGWASFWLDRGYKVYIVDDWSVGRSGSETSSAGGRLTVEAAEQGFTAPELYNEYYQARFHTQWPGVSVNHPAEISRKPTARKQQLADRHMY